MASRARNRRQYTPGYKAKPSKEEREELARKTRRQVHQALSTVIDPEELVVDEAPRVKGEHAVAQEVHGDRVPGAGRPPKAQARRRVRKSPFWKRRSKWQQEKSKLDAKWDEIQLPKLD